MSDYKPFTAVDDLMTDMFGHADGRGDCRGDLTGNELDVYKVNDSGAAMVPDPVADFCQKVAANRFNKAGSLSDPAWNEPIGDAPKKISKAVRYEVSLTSDGDKVSTGYDAAGELVSWRVLLPEIE